MLKDVKEILNLKLPRWDELPSFDIYSDQLVTIVEESCGPIYRNEEKIITKSMINNYVKLYRMEKPEKKKYAKTQIAYCVIVTLLKKVLIIDDIVDGIEWMIQKESASKSYDFFCDEFEKAIYETFSHLDSSDSSYELKPYNIDMDILSIPLICRSICYKILVEMFLEEIKPKLIIEEW